MRWIKKCLDTFQNCHDVLYQHATFGRDRTTRAGCRSENWCFLYVTLGLPARGGHSSNKYCVTAYGSILMRFSALFSECSVRCTIQFSFLLLGGATIFANCGQKLRKVQKSAEKFVRTTSYKQLRDLKKIPLQQFRAQNVDVHLYNFFPHDVIQR